MEYRVAKQVRGGMESDFWRRGGREYQAAILKDAIRFPSERKLFLYWQVFLISSEPRETQRFVTNLRP